VVVPENMVGDPDKDESFTKSIKEITNIGILKSKIGNRYSNKIL
jgi:hypothetical protein